jgi:hypothetical protein
MKKHYHKRKKVVIDVLDGKIINEDKAIKLCNIAEYLEKNGLKILKVMTLFILFNISIHNIYAFDASYMLAMDLTLTYNINILISIIVFSFILIFLGFSLSNFTLSALGCLLMFFIGLILILNGFNVLICILLIVIPLIIIWMWA